MTHAAQLVKRFWAKVDKAGECWLWTAAKDRYGYGEFKVGGRHGRRVRPHRLAYEMHNGQIPADLEIDHLCRNRACVRPDHLEAVAKKENILRGASPAAHFARRDKCPKGHPFDEGNTRWEGKGRRRCRACDSERARVKRRRSA
jgi:hypothetical protein